MGIKGLTAVISDHAPAAIKNNDIKNYFGRKVAIDASMSIYQFLIAVRQQDGQQLMSDTGETTSHLMGIFYRTIRMVDYGIKPCYVFDGKPPKLKNGTLAKRAARRDLATTNIEEAKEVGTAEDLDKFSRRTVRVTKEHNQECRRLLTLMGIPWLEAETEAEAQCAALAKAGKVYAAASEDMDTLTFASPILLRHLTFSEARKEPISEVHLDKALSGLELSFAQFVDLCILLGCDYCEPIKGIGPKTALKLVKEHGSLESVVASLGDKVPEDWPYKEVRELFVQPEVKDPNNVELEWKAPDMEGIVQFLVREKGFSEERVRSSVSKLQKSLSVKQQGRLDGFFKTISSSPTEQSKRKADDKKANSGPSKKAKPSGGRGKPK